MALYDVYLLQHTQTKRLYDGYTANRQQRLAQHVQRGPWQLVYDEAYHGEQDARERERHLKHDGQAIAALRTRLKQSVGS